MQGSEYGSTVAEASATPSVFRAFAPDEFIEWSTWRKLENILENNGGAYGIAGPRGSGKTWLIQRGVHRAKALEGLGLWFPSPSNYSAVEFLTALSENFAAEVQRIAQGGAPRWYDRLASVPLFIASLLLVVAAAYSLASPLDPFSPLVSGAALVAGTLLMSGAVMGLRRRGSASVQLFRGATTLHERIRYSEARRSSAEATAGLKGASWLGSMRSSRERDLTERTFHLASLVHELRVLMSLTAERLRRPIVVAIDELDKIHDPDDARKLLRDVKGIFEVAGVHFLVSVSREAQRTLDLGSIRGRDEFQSSFYAVIGMERRSPDECAELLRKRIRNRTDHSDPEDSIEPGLVKHETACALGVLGEGNLREVTRLAQIALDDYTDPPSRSSRRYEPVPLGPDRAVHSVLRSEVQAFQRELLNSSLPTHLKGRAHDALPSWQGSPPTPTDLARFQEEWLLLRADGEPRDSSTPPSSTDDYPEAWRRLLVRLAIGGTMLAYRKVLHENQEFWSELQRITSVAGSSASVAAVRLRSVRGELYGREVKRLEYDLEKLGPGAKLEQLRDGFKELHATARDPEDERHPKIEELIDLEDKLGGLELPAAKLGDLPDDLSRLRAETSLAANLEELRARIEASQENLD